MLQDLNIGTIVDTLGALKAEIAALQERESAIKADLIATGLTAIDGTIFRATLSTTERRSTSAEKLAKLLAERGVDPALIAACCHEASTFTPTTTLRVVARKS